jgi:hypothetical protein
LINSNRYEEHIKDERKHETNTYNSTNGDSDTGNWIGNKRTRRDVISYSNGDRYDGRVKDGKKHGIGTYNWASGDKYTGNWIDGNRTGYTLLTLGPTEIGTREN